MNTQIVSFSGGRTSAYLVWLMEQQRKFSKQSDIREQNRYYGVKLADKGREFIAKATGESK